jgi:DNA mismatch repair protein MSH4
MAQLGCYVAADFASIRPVDRLFTRIGTSDSIETNSSSFMVEMQDTAHIVSHATSKCACPAALAAWCGTV